MAAMTSKALTAWTELNDRQQGTLAAIYELDQANEAARRRDAAAGSYDSAPAAVWRQIDFAHEPSLRDLFGLTSLQSRLSGLGWDNQGNGATMAALAHRGLITRDARFTEFGTMHTVALTREGRAAARAGTSPRTGPAPKAALSERSWQVLAQLWDADQRGEHVEWVFSKTIDYVLIGKHDPPLAESTGAGYKITDRGRDFYREQYAVHVAAHPEVWAPHPDGAAAEPWPERADDILLRHYNHCRALRSAWRRAVDDHQLAEKEAAGGAAATPDPLLPDAAAQLDAARRALWRETARQRAELAAVHVDELFAHAERAARAYAVTASAAFRAAVEQADPVSLLSEPGSIADWDDDWDEQRLVPPARTSITVIDAEATKLHAAAMGTPVRRRGPAPKKRSRHASRRPGRPVLSPAPDLAVPGGDLIALADFLRIQLSGGALLRRLHPVTPLVNPQNPETEEPDCRGGRARNSPAARSAGELSVRYEIVSPRHQEPNLHRCPELNGVRKLWLRIATSCRRWWRPSTCTASSRPTTNCRASTANQTSCG